MHKRQRSERDCTVKNGVFQNSCLWCLNVHSSTTPNRVFLKPQCEGVTGHPQNTLTSGSESLKVVLCKYFHISFSTTNGVTLYSINSQLYVIVSDILIHCNILQYLIVLQNQKKTQHIILCCYKRRKNSPYIFLVG